jgi:hypothetical protein
MTLRGTTLASANAESTLQGLVNNLISGEMRYSHVIEEASKHYNYDLAVSALKKQQVPKELGFLLTSSNRSQTTTATTTLSEDSLKKARDFLNSLVVSTYVELDAKLIETKEFELKNRAVFRQITADMARLGQQIADHIKAASEATTCITDTTQQIEDIKEKKTK